MGSAYPRGARPGRTARTGAGPARRWQAGIPVALPVILVAALALDVVVALHPGPLPGDVRLTLVWQQWVLPHPLLTAFLEEISALNWPRPALITSAVVVALAALARRVLDIAVALGTLVCATGTNTLTSHLVRRPRPAGFGIVIHQQITDFYSYPSGHVEHAVAFLGIVLCLTFTVPHPWPWLRPILWLVRLFLLVQIVLMPLSRVAEGEHWPSDTLGSFLYGGFWLLAGIWAYGRAARRWPRLLPPNERPTTAAG